jgi:tetratricopeptide (TPR) repeat protein
MHITKKQWIFSGGALLVVAVAVLGWSHSKTFVPAVVSGITASSTVPTGGGTLTGQATSTVTGATIQPFPINSADTIVSWSFTGAYTGNDTLIAQANADIVHLKSLLGKGQYDDYDLYLGIGNDDNLMGNGRGAYANYDHSIAIHPKKGLAYANLGHLMDELGAYNTAADAYAKAAEVQPTMLEYFIEQLTYLTRQFPKDDARISAAIADANKQFGDTAQILSIEAEWLTGQGRYADAIKAWQTAKTLSPGADTSSIDTEIARLKAKQ